MGRNCPLQSAQPLGGKLKLTIFISLMNGSDIIFSTPSGEVGVNELRAQVLRRAWKDRSGNGDSKCTEQLKAPEVESGRGF
jgi:hypothetical protein